MAFFHQDMSAAGFFVRQFSNKYCHNVSNTVVRTCASGSDEIYKRDEMHPVLNQYFVHDYQIILFMRRFLLMVNTVKNTGYILLIFLAGILTSVYCLQVYADVYKWVDEQGEVHYSQFPPENKKAETLKIPAGGEPEAERKSLERQLFEVEKIETQRKQELEKKKQQADDQDLRKENCRRARAKLESLDTGTNILEIDQQGNAKRLKEEERQIRLKVAKNDIAKWCD